MADPAFILLGFPVQVERADGGEFAVLGGKADGLQNANVDVVAGVDPDGDEEGEVGGDKWGVEVGEGFGGLS